MDFRRVPARIGRKHRHSTVRFSLRQNGYNAPVSAARPSEPMSVKYWSFAGLMLTSWCNARCACCYLCCGPDRQEAMTVDQALGIWRSLQEACPHGCRVHISGGEPFGEWPRLIELARRAQAQGLGPLEKVETNAFWAQDGDTVRDRLAALDAAGMGKLVISTDPYHQAFVPIAAVRLAARVAEEVLSPSRVQVRWRDWLAEGFDTAGMAPQAWGELVARYAARGRDRLCGRAAVGLTAGLQLKDPREFADQPCRSLLLRSRHVHIDPAGCVMPGTCAGLVLGRVGPDSIAQIWQRLSTDHATRPVLGRLASQGPVGLLPVAQAGGFVPQAGYAGKCHLCWDIRRWLVLAGRYGDELGPVALYEAPT